MTRLRPVAALAAAGLACAVPVSNPDGTGMQWDEAVLFLLASWACWQLLRTAAGTARRTALPWRVMGAGAALFAVAQGLEAAFPEPGFDGFGVDKVLLFAGACTPLVTCALLALRVRRTRWTALVVDGLTTTVGLFVVSEILASRGVLVDDAPPDLRSMVLLYGGYAAVVLGGAGALCTVSTAALRRSATAAMGAVAGQAAAAACEAMAIVAPSPLWTAGSDAAVAASLLLFVHAARVAPREEPATGARAAVPAVSSLGLALVVLGLLAVPLALVAAVASGHPLGRAAELGCAVVLLLVAARVVLVIREDGRVTQDLVRTEEDFRSLVESSSDGVAIVDGGLRLLFTSPAARRLLGLPDEAADITGDVALPDLVSDDTRPVLLLGLLDGSATEGSLHVHVPTADGSRELQVQIAERGGDRRVLYLRDVTTRRRRERELERMAFTDHLTGLPNRALLFSELDDVRAVPGGEQRCLLVLDLDGFKAVNDRAGHEHGDHLLVEVGRRLTAVVRDDDLVARLGGDEFAVLVAGSLEESVEVAQRLVEALGLPFLVDGEAFGIGGSVGVARIGAGGGRLAFREADAALRTAKAAGKGCLRVAGTASAGAVDVAGALARAELELRFDTVADASGRPALVHAVPAWRHPELGAVRGSELWAAAEAQGVAPELQRWLLGRATTAVAGLPAPLDVAVSLPGGPVQADDLAGEVRGALASSGLPASRLVLSFSEETLLTSSAALVPALEAVRASGVRLCLDGYGMGQSLFALLARVPLDVVRADLAALAGRDDTARMLQVLDAVLRFTAGFGITVIAGGLSTPELLDSARAAGVELAHGRALPHDLDGGALTALVADRLAVPTA